MISLPADVIVAYALLYILIFIFGSAIGSFLNVVIYRLPRKISFVKGRSHCPFCDTQLKAYDMLPILSYFILGGKCRNCKATISCRYPLVEALTGLAAVLTVFALGLTLESAAVFMIISALLAVAFIDLDTMEIPNGLIIFLFIPAIILLFTTPNTSILAHIIGFFAVALPLFLLTLLIPDCFGGGDIKLIAVCGLALAWQNILLAMFIALVFGGGYGIYLLVKTKADRKSHFAFGPFLAGGIIISALIGPQIIDLYLSLFF